LRTGTLSATARLSIDQAPQSWGHRGALPEFCTIVVQHKGTAASNMNQATTPTFVNTPRVYSRGWAFFILMFKQKQGHAP